MIRNALFLTTILFLALGLFLMQECKFLIPYRHLLWATWGHAALTFAAALFVNLFAGIYAAWRKVFLKDTGRKLAHLEKQLRTGASVSDELSELLKDAR